MPNKNHVADLIPRHYHGQVHHQGRQIIVRFLRFPERELVFRKVRDLGGELEVKVYADLPKIIRDRRQKLLPKMKKAREEGKVAFFDKREPDKLYIDGILSI